MSVPAARLEVVNSATPLTSVALPIVPPWSLKVTVPPVGVAPPADRSLTVAVNVTDCPETAETVEALSAVIVGRALSRARCSRRPTWGRNPMRHEGVSGRRIRRPRRQGALPAPQDTDAHGETPLGARAERALDGPAERESESDGRSFARSRSGVVMASALQGA